MSLLSLGFALFFCFAFAFACALALALLCDICVLTFVFWLLLFGFGFLVSSVQFSVFSFHFLSHPVWFVLFWIAIFVNVWLLCLRSFLGCVRSGVGLRTYWSFSDLVCFLEVFSSTSFSYEVFSSTSFFTKSFLRPLFSQSLFFDLFSYPFALSANTLAFTTQFQGPFRPCTLGSALM